MSVRYEWDVETVTADEYSDITDHDFCDSYAEAARKAANPAPPGQRYEVVLVRDDDDRRAWAYIDGGKLPEWFEDASGEDYKRVPLRFHAEVAK